MGFCDKCEFRLAVQCCLKCKSNVCEACADIVCQFCARSCCARCVNPCSYCDLYTCCMRHGRCKVCKALRTLMEWQALLPQLTTKTITKDRQHANP